METAVVAGVDETIAPLVVQLAQHGHAGELGTPQGRELPVSLPSQGEEGIPAVHEVTVDQLVRVGGGRERRGT